jgi:DNA-binding transcriptional ArsR family regulator
VFAALADPTRRYVIERLAHEPSVTSTALASQLPITRQAVTKHLMALADAGLVASARAGRETRYRLAPDAFAEAAAWMVRVGGEWDERLDRLNRLLSGPA